MEDNSGRKFLLGCLAGGGVVGALLIRLAVFALWSLRGCHYVHP